MTDIHGQYLRNNPHPMELRFTSALVWIVPTWLAAGAAGAWPTWHLGGRDAINCMLLAGGITLVATLVGTLLVVRSARLGPARAAMTFLASGLVQGVVAIGAATGAAVIIDAPLRVTLVWTAIFYVPMLVAQSLWLYCGLRRDALRAALGEIERRAGL